MDQIAADGHGLVMVMGKGGVGKTTLAAAVAVELAHRGLPVHLTTSDPAAHLTETLSETLENLSVSRIDPHTETERYRLHVLETKGAKLDAQGRSRIYLKDSLDAARGGDLGPIPVYATDMRVEGLACR